MVPGWVSFGHPTAGPPRDVGVLAHFVLFRKGIVARRHARVRTLREAIETIVKPSKRWIHGAFPSDSLCFLVARRLLYAPTQEVTMFTLRPSRQRGHAQHGWLDSWHTFSFADYHDPKHMGFRALRVINDDRIAPGMGFGTHPHRDMEIVTYILDGALEHRDSLGTGSVIRPGDAQRMSAGSGIRHSEFNASPTDEVHLLQIWIVPSQSNLVPSYEQKSLVQRDGALTVVASPDGRDGSVTLHQDASLYVAHLRPGDRVQHSLAPGRHLWIHVARGASRIHGHDLHEGDGLSVSDEGSVVLLGGDTQGEVLLFDLA